MPATAVLDVQGLRRRFDATEAVAGVDLRVAAGETVALLGPDGADIAKVLPTYRLVDLGRAAVTRHALNPADIAFLVAWTLLFGAIAAWCYRGDQQHAIG